MITITSIDIVTGIITATAHGITTGWALGWKSGVTSQVWATLPTTTDKDITYFAHAIDADTLTLHLRPDDAATGANPITYTDAGSGARQLYRLDIKERIGRRMLAIARTITGIGTVRRIEQRAARLDNGDAIVGFEEITVVETSMQSSGYTTKNAEIVVGVKVGQSEKDPEASDALLNRWIATIDLAVIADANRQLLEPGDSMGLAIWVLPNGSEFAQLDANQNNFAACARYVIQYRHKETDPYSRI